MTFNLKLDVNLSQENNDLDYQPCVVSSGQKFFYTPSSKCSNDSPSTNSVRRRTISKSDEHYFKLCYDLTLKRCSRDY